MAFLLKALYKWGFQHNLRKETKPNMWKRLSQKSGQGWVKNLSMYVAQHNWTDFWLKRMVMFCLLFSFVFVLKNLIPPAEEDLEKKQKSRKRGKLDRLLTEKRQILDRFWLYNMCVYIYIYRERERARSIDRHVSCEATNRTKTGPFQLLQSLWTGPSWC